MMYKGEYNTGYNTGYKSGYQESYYQQNPNSDPMFQLAKLLANGNEKEALINLNKPNKIQKYNMALTLTNGDVKTARDILDYLTIVKARRRGMTKSQYIHKKKDYKRKMSDMQRKIQQEQEKAFKKMYDIERSYKGRKRSKRILGGLKRKSRKSN